ncbi:MAG: hypothetical protein IJ637_07890 [Prevotella sp.]|nr:hypothetical protein [Prevotella sp.]
MKKRLLLQLMAALFAIGMYAQGQYLYTHTAKYVTIDANLVTNSNFDQGADGFEGWQNELGQELMSQFWAKEAAAGPDGINALISLSSDATDGSALIYKVNNASEGSYTVSFWIKAEESFTSSITSGAANYIDVYANKTGDIAKAEDTKQIAQTELIGTAWQQVVFPVEVESGDVVVVNMAKLPAGTMVAGVAVNPVLEVFDTRIADRLLAYADRLLADPNLPNGHEEFKGWIEEDFKAALANQEMRDDKNEMMDFVEAFNNEYVTAFLDANGANLFPTYLQDWTTWGQYNYSKLGTKDNWTFEGGRWGFTGNTNYLEFAEGDGYIASAGIQNTGQYTLDASVRTRDEKLDALPAGKYFFSIEAQAVAAANRANPYGSNHSVVIANPYFFIGSDTITVADTLNGYYWKTYYAIGEIKDGDKKVLGFHFPIVDGKTGGRYSVRNPKAYLIGTSQDDMEFEAQKEAFIVQQFNLNKRLTEYPAELSAAEYPWEQDSLAHAIAEAQPVYEASLAVIDAEGNVLDRDQVTEEYTQLLLDQVNALGRARNFVITQNAPVATLRETVAAANASLADPANAAANAAKRAALQDAVNYGQNLLDNISATNQGDAFTSAAADIMAAKEEFESTSASRANPAEILIKNADFADFSAGSNITSFDAPTKDWNWSVAASANRWEIRDNETLSQGHGASIWRGTTVGLDGKAQQTVELTYEGLYEYRAEAYISEERIAELVAAAEILETGDTIFTPNIRLFFGEDGLADSIAISKWYNGVKADGTYFTRDVSGTLYGGMVYATYSLFFKKTGTAPVSVEFGLEARDNSATAGANGFGFGNNKIYYVGDETQYLADTRTDLNAAVAAAKTLAATHPDSYWTVKLNRYIADAEAATTAKQMQNALWGIGEVSSRLKGIATGIEAITTTTAAAKTAASGVYTLTGVKIADKAASLKPGLYIANGKKVIIK